MTRSTGAWAATIVYAVLGQAPDHDAVRAMQGFVDEEIEVVYE